MNILFLSGWFPYPPNNGSKLRIYHLLRGLASEHSLTLLCLSDGTETAEDLAHLRTFCREVQLVRRKEYAPNQLRARLGLLSPTPRSIVDTFSDEMKAALERTMRRQPIDLIIASQLGTAAYAHYFGDIPALFEEVEIGVFHGQYAGATTLRSRLRHGLTWMKYRRYLAHLLPRFGACTVVSDEEKALLAQVAPSYGAVHVVPNCVRVADYPQATTPQMDQLIFTGSFRYWPNYEAMHWFLSGAYPRIRAQLPNVRLLITGDQAGYPLPTTDGVIATGFVDDVRPLIANAGVSVVPIHSGGGTRLKILEAMATGTPVVTTTKGAEGLDIRHEEHVLKADTPELFADAVVRLLRDRELRQRLAANAHTKVRQTYDWDAAIPRFLELVAQTAARRVASAETTG
jgi:polysaccharide biosynthesis protein PslH